MLFLSVRGFSDYAGPTVHSRLAWLPCCLPPTRNEVGILIYGLFAAQSPRPPMPLSTLHETPHDVPRKTRGQDGFATSSPVGLLHPLQHAGLSRRTPNCPYAPEESLCETDDEHRASDRLGRKVRPMTREPDVARRTTRREDGSAGQHRALIVRVSLTDARGQLSS